MENGSSSNMSLIKPLLQTTPFTPSSLTRIRSILSNPATAIKSTSWDEQTQTFVYAEDRKRVMTMMYGSDSLPEKVANEKDENDGEKSTVSKLLDAIGLPAKFPTPRVPDPDLPKPRQAAVLIPLINIETKDLNGTKVIEPGILLEVRAGGMRMHSGEIR